MKVTQNDTTAVKGGDWKFVSTTVALITGTAEVFKKLNIGPEILEWVAGDGKEIFESQFLIPLARRFVANGEVFKNWPKICAIQDWHLRISLARAVPNSETGKRLAVAYPEAFSAIKVQGPVPLSVLKDFAIEYNAARLMGAECPQERLYHCGALDHFGVPYVAGCWSEKVYAQHGRELDWALVPFEFETKGFGSVVEFSGQTFFVAENTTDSQSQVYLVPVECIDIGK